MQSRWRSPVAWGAIVAVVAFVLGNYGLYEYIGLTPESFQKFIDLIFIALAAFGIFNNPEKKDGF